MAEILAFVRNTPRSTRIVQTADDSSTIVVFPGASVGLLQALWENPEGELVSAGPDARIDN
ncbi:MAG: hypothetical protein JWR89_335 [Tardiphaga sp.]|uniref:hypothetical protein n=1 Tax=Tardiphaga sp. TaxID=1926292 RepID=UPI00261DB5CB|nr:hypothetical protein [Tardiphaga sp.]MDB5500433.1 hypothetical protein [Tardiphaga sp.]